MVLVSGLGKVNVLQKLDISSSRVVGQEIDDQLLPLVPVDLVVPQEVLQDP